MNLSRIARRARLLVSGAATIAALASTPAWAGPSRPIQAQDQPMLRVPAPVGWVWSLASTARRSEAGRMLEGILRGRPINGPGSWFDPGRSLVNPAWLANTYDRDRDFALTPEEFTGPPAWFDRLDRDRDGIIRGEDFDWTERSPVVQLLRGASGRFADADRDGDGQLSPEEWKALYDRATGGGARPFTPEDLAGLFYLGQRRAAAEQNPAVRQLDTALGLQARSSKPRPPADNPTQYTLIKGLLSGEIGSFREGPRPGTPAPDFTLKTHDGSRTISLSEFRGKKPVVLIFGSFT